MSFLMDFFETDDLDEKYDLVCRMDAEEEVTDSMIDNMAASLDVVINDGDIMSRIEELKRCLRTKMKYESIRLRRGK